jgi:hypothetical protein
MSSTQAPADHGAPADQQVLSVLLYSSNPLTREQVKLAVGQGPAREVAPARWAECATERCPGYR